MSEDAKVSLGGDLSPFMAQMERAKELAAKGGEAAGLEFGNRTAYMAEQRVKRGMDGVLKSLATAKDPIDAITGAVEGLSQSFRVAGAALLGVGIGTFLKEQLEKAAEGAQDFYEKTDDIFALTNSSSKEFTDKAIKNFEEAKAAYGKEGFFEWLIYGAGQKETLKNGEEAYTQALAHARSMREASYRAEADARSSNEEERLRGEIEKINERYDAEVDKANQTSDSIVEIERARSEEIEKIHEEAADKNAKLQQELIAARLDDPGNSKSEQLQNKRKAAQSKVDEAGGDLSKKDASVRDAQAKVDAAKRESDFRNKVIQQVEHRGDGTPWEMKALRSSAKDADDSLRQRQEELAGEQARRMEGLITQQKALNELKAVQLEISGEAAKAEKEESDGLIRSKEEAAELQSKLNEVGMTDLQKSAALRKKIEEDKKKAAQLAPLQTSEQKQDAQNSITRDQIKLKELIAPKKNSADSSQRDVLADEEKKAKAEALSKRGEALGFHGVVSSLRRVGFGRTPAASHDNAALKSAAAAVTKLTALEKEMIKLNSKIGGAA